MTYKQAERLTRCLSDQIIGLQAWESMRTEGNLLYEAEWVLETVLQRDEEDWWDEFEWTKRDVSNLKRYIKRLRAKGVTPEPWQE